MRLDPEHVEAITKARTDDGGFRLSPERLRILTEHLSVWEHGLAMRALNRAMSAKRLTREQRVLLALFIHRDEEASHEAV